MSDVTDYKIVLTDKFMLQLGTHMPRPSPPTDLDRWAPAARALPAGDYTPRRALRVELAEAIAVAQFFAAHWQPSLDASSKEQVPGLSAAGKRLPASTGDDIMSLQLAASAAQQLFLQRRASPSGGGSAHKTKAIRLVRDLVATLEWATGDAPSSKAARQLATVKRAHSNDPVCASALAAHIHDLVSIAGPLASQLEGLGGFTASTLDEADAFARELLLLPATAQAYPARRAASDARELRDRLMFLLRERVSLVRAAARFVYRNHPGLLRQVTSADDRARKARSYARKKAG